MEAKVFLFSSLILLSQILSVYSENITVETAGCFEFDTEYEGHNIYEIPFRGISTPQQCYLLCKKEKFCHSWTWTPEQDCHLKDGAAFLNRVTAFSAGEESTEKSSGSGKKLSDLYVKTKSLIGKVSGPRQCHAVNQLKCYDIGTDFEGYDLLKLETNDFESPLECHHACGKTKNCFYWTWDSEKQNCYLKVNDATMGWKKDETTKHLISGAGVCGECYEPSTDYFGHDIVRIENQAVISAEQCRTYCVRNRNCFFWTWVPQSERCYLKDQYAYQGKAVDENTQGMVSGAKNCENHGISIFYNFHKFPTDYQTMSGKFIDLNNSQMTSRQMYISLVHSKTCFNIDTEYMGYDIVKYENGDVPSAQDCQKLCKGNDQCFYWTWDTKSNFCSLKGYLAYKGQTKNSSTAGKISATKFCPCPGF